MPSPEGLKIASYLFILSSAIYLFFTADRILEGNDIMYIISLLTGAGIGLMIILIYETLKGGARR